MSILLSLQVSGAKRVRRGHEHYWACILKLGRNGASFKSKDVVDLCDIDRPEFVYDYLRRLEKAGYIKDVGKAPRGKGRPAVFELVRAPQETPRINRDGSPGLQGNAQKQMWNAMRILPIFSAQELAVQSSTDEVKVPASSAKRYCTSLVSAGYLSVRDPGSGSRPAIYSLKPGHNTGPRPPAVLRGKAVWDQNRKQIMGRVLAEEEAL